MRATLVAGAPRRPLRPPARWRVPGWDATGARARPGRRRAASRQRPRRGAETLRLGAGRSRGRAVALLVRGRDRPRGGDEAGGAVGREGGREVLDPPALGADARQKENG